MASDRTCHTVVEILLTQISAEFPVEAIPLLSLSEFSY
jgi:hypothetical protein